MAKILQFMLIIVFSLMISGCSLDLSDFSFGRNTSNEFQPVKSGIVAVIEENLVVNSPVNDDVVSSPLKVSGRVRSVDNTVNFQLKDDLKNIIASGSKISSATGSEFGYFQIELNFNPPSTPIGWLEVYSKNTDGSQDFIKIPIFFTDYVKPVVKVYFNNTEGDPELIDCEKVYPVERQVNYSNPLMISALGELFVGPTEEEVNNGFLSTLPTEGVKILGLEVKDGVAYVDFNQALQAGVAGSCRVIAIRSQITETLKQFADVDEVVISVEGKTEDVLQP